MVEIGIGVMVSRCLNRIPNKEWMFTVDKAREKLGRAYPVIANRPARRTALA